jgi:hypothetical protein
MNLDDILVMQFAEILDFADGRHVEAIFELADFDFLDSYFASGANFPP